MEEDLSEQRKALLWSTAHLLGYLGIGVLWYWWAEGWDFSDCFYFSVTCMSTVGYGDFHPSWAGSRVFTCAYILVGILVVFHGLESIFNDTT